MRFPLGSNGSSSATGETPPGIREVLALRSSANSSYAPFCEARKSCRVPSQFDPPLWNCVVLVKCKWEWAASASGCSCGARTLILERISSNFQTCLNILDIFAKKFDNSIEKIRAWHVVVVETL